MNSDGSLVAVAVTGVDTIVRVIDVTAGKVCVCVCVCWAAPQLLAL